VCPERVSECVCESERESQSSPAIGATFVVVEPIRASLRCYSPHLDQKEEHADEQRDMDSEDSGKDSF
jgi:hypothetical protein